MIIYSWLNFGRPAPPGRVVCGGANIFDSVSLQPARSVCVSSERFFIVYESFVVRLSWKCLGPASDGTVLIMSLSFGDILPLWFSAVAALDVYTPLSKWKSIFCSARTHGQNGWYMSMRAENKENNLNRMHTMVVGSAYRDQSYPIPSLILGRRPMCGSFLVSYSHRSV